MTQLHLGQEVEVATLSAGDRPLLVWHKAKITSLAQYPKWEGDPEQTIESYFVDLPDGMRDVFDADNIRAIECGLEPNISRMRRRRKRMTLPRRG
jgi:hypothetical protein